MSRMLVIISILLTVNISFAASVLKAVNAYQVGEEFVTELNFNEPIENSQLNLEYINQTVQLSLTGVVLEDEVLKRKITNHERIKSIYTYQPKENIVYSRIIQKDNFKAEDLKNAIDIEHKGNIVFVKIRKPTAVALVEKSTIIKPVVESISVPEFAMIPPRNLNEKPSVVLPGKIAKKAQLATTLLAQEMKSIDKSIDAIKAPAKIEKSIDSKLNKKTMLGRELSEAEIPVLTTLKKKKKSTTSPVLRMVLSLIVVVVMGLALTFFTKWWSKRNTKSLDNNKIRMLTQHHLGPKKSLAIIQVAGESILIGVTDQNINMIKTLSLLDEEIPEISSGSSFENSLEAKIATDKALAVDENDEFALTKIKDLVSTKLKDMRHF